MSTTPSAHPENELHPVLGIPWRKLPRHIAIIMDGNGRWATRQGKPRLEGHAAGSNSVRGTIIECSRLGIECLTLYSFSTENWKRPQAEINGLMHLYAYYLREERQTIIDHNIRVRHLGSEDRLPAQVIDQLHQTIELSKNHTGLTLCLALNYSGRSEIVRAVQHLAGKVKEGSLALDAIDEAAIDAALDTAGLPDPDLLIRTAGENRISNFLLWQISYAELYVTDAYWPDFDTTQLHAAIKSFAARNRRFGGIGPKAL
ncbi:MAG: isoprenyl transferase [Sedimentisphaerales bacterium]|nr:isoprenyl transferase [Sedimentisphaerales bacterium]